MQDELVVLMDKGMNIILNFALLSLEVVTEMIDHMTIKSAELHLSKALHATRR